ncbi:MAG TPA: TIGR00303 family protein [Methanocorpusculum sp.]|nr:TIGR00303 family protein [Methanocorpusculum sp.]
MTFVSTRAGFECESPLFALILSNSVVSAIPGVSGAGEDPNASMFVPNLDAELIINGELSGDMTPNTPTGCPTPASITLSMMDLIGMKPLLIASGLNNEVVVPHMNLGEKAGGDPRQGNAVPNARTLFEKGRWIGEFLSQSHDLLVLGECLPGGTTTALCVLRALGYNAKVSSAQITNPVAQKEEIAKTAVDIVRSAGITDPLDITAKVGDPMLPVAAGIAEGFRGKLFLAGGTQMLAAAALCAALGNPVPDVVTTTYVYNDSSASFKETAAAVGADSYYVDPDFSTIGHAGLARYAQGEIKEGSGAGGAMFLASILGFTPEEIRTSIREHVTRYN